MCLYLYVTQRCQPKTNTEDCRFSIFSTSQNIHSVLLFEGKEICFPKLARISGKNILWEIQSPHGGFPIRTYVRVGLCN